MHSYDKTLLEIETQLLDNTIALDSYPLVMEHLDSIQNNLATTDGTLGNTDLINCSMKVVARNLGLDSITELGIDDRLSGESIVGAAKNVIVKIFTGIAAAASKAAELIMRFIRWVGSLFTGSSAAIKADKKVIDDTVEKAVEDTKAVTENPGEIMGVATKKKITAADLVVFQDTKGALIDPNIIKGSLSKVFKDTIDWKSAKKVNRIKVLDEAYRKTAYIGTTSIVANITTGVKLCETMLNTNAWKELSTAEYVLSAIEKGDIKAIAEADGMFGKFEKSITGSGLMKGTKDKYAGAAFPGLRSIDAKRITMFPNIPESDNVTYLSFNVVIGKFSESKHRPSNYGEMDIDTSNLDTLSNLMAQGETLVKAAEAHTDVMIKFVSKYAKSGKELAKVVEGLNDKGGELTKVQLDNLTKLARFMTTAVINYSNVLKTPVLLLNGYNSAAKVLSNEIKTIVNELKVK